MTFTIKPTKENMQWIQQAAQKEAQKIETISLDHWTVDGGSIADERTAITRSRALVYRKRKQDPRQNYKRTVA